MTRLRAVLGFAAILVALVSITMVANRAKQNKPAPPATAPSFAAASTPPAPTSTGLQVPTPAIPLPTTCPSRTAPQVDNPGRYGFCTPVGWAAYNENNSLAQTLLLKPRPGGSQILNPTDFDRLQIVIALNTARPSALPEPCNGPPNDSIGGLPARHCAVALDPDTHPLHGVRAEFWLVSLPGNRQFNMTATIGADSSEEDQQMVSAIIHNVRPPTGQ